MYFEVLSEITQIKRIAAGSSIRSLAGLRKKYGGSRWRKMKGLATVRLADGTIHVAELHWYEAHGVGRKDFKVKRLRDQR